MSGVECGYFREIKYRPYVKNEDIYVNRKGESVYWLNPPEIDIDED